MSRVGTESNAIRSRYFPQQSANYYQVTWEPKRFWTDSDANFVQLYKTVYQGIHATDPHSVVMGPTDAFPTLTIKRLSRLAPLGFGQYIDGVATHGYYDADTSPSHPPERLATDPNPANAANALMNEIHNLRQLMATSYRPGMKLFQTEVGISYGQCVDEDVHERRVDAQCHRVAGLCGVAQRIGGAGQRNDAGGLYAGLTFSAL
jgi:hypothetical protein